MGKTWDRLLLVVGVLFGIVLAIISYMNSFVLCTVILANVIFTFFIICAGASVDKLPKPVRSIIAGWVCYTLTYCFVFVYLILTLPWPNK